MQTQEVIFPNARARMSAMFELEGHFWDGVRDKHYLGRKYTVALAFYANVAFFYLQTTASEWRLR